MVFLFFYGTHKKCARMVHLPVVYAKLCISDTIKNINVKVFNIMSRTNETRHKNGIKHANENLD